LLAATSDLLTRDIYGKWINPQADPNSMRRQVSIIIVLLGFLTWLIALPGWNLLDVLFISGPLVGSAIAPIVAGLYWENANRQGVLIAMLAGSAAGLIAFFTIGWFVASLIATALSLLIVALTTRLMPQRFDWSQLDESRLNSNPRS
jgi:Na+/proline symporter